MPAAESIIDRNSIDGGGRHGSSRDYQVRITSPHPKDEHDANKAFSAVTAEIEGTAVMIDGSVVVGAEGDRGPQSTAAAAGVRDAMNPMSIPTPRAVGTRIASARTATLGDETGAGPIESGIATGALADGNRAETTMTEWTDEVAGTCSRTAAEVRATIGICRSVEAGAAPRLPRKNASPLQTSRASRLSWSGSAA